ncbi:hypothetical protein Sme01_67780 [Sphaerisporangium melleum]|uniref:YCII-related domain-containing protein n=1 Tax=Sphaerisporangium melleum TaxID=321316 RepID=A0A917VQA1_9ACTN|nr:YciI family protein [Sphaerisporangium melleum]GGL08064.1 hypothetical protein GCM10007964_57870 [Sphaerisporangium melleum]GII74302.1 hypothetical protein Sme01_67780 [Sphaerisporangium melleum]
MKYMLMIYNNPAVIASLPQDEQDAMMGEVGTLMAELVKSGECVGGAALADASRATTVRVRDGVPVTTDGPFAEAKEQLAGYLIVECASDERAAEIAASWPDARRWAMEVRPIVHSVDAQV